MFIAFIGGQAKAFHVRHGQWKIDVDRLSESCSTINEANRKLTDAAFDLSCNNYRTLGRSNDCKAYMLVSGL
ncbi:hypothetical protein D918_08082 [Trichuris suis]|nr:hypothetical protein D918_08082 [Trichuris suis]